MPSPARIAFASNRDGNFEVYAMSADGSGPAQQSRAADHPITRESSWGVPHASVAFGRKLIGH